MSADEENPSRPSTVIEIPREAEDFSGMSIPRLFGSPKHSQFTELVGREILHAAGFQPASLVGSGR